MSNVQCILSWTLIIEHCEKTLPPVADRRKSANSFALERGMIKKRWCGFRLRRKDYFKCLPTSLVISNMLTWGLPPKTGFNAASALIIRLFLLSCSPFFLM